ncbi:uncharacterized protein LOC129914403 [Episyrphus balteatus]|uniref:uncharacterized protein LOC129914403 n=1 Tax=Episyrphus balteatus TaxID=286459 RepID=UPI002485A0B4|nr:uncharacterized protein LOC129914403 [Episyrphus balteatus]
MILSFVLILVLCSALSFPQYNRFSDTSRGDISDIKLVLKKNAKLGEDNDLDLVERVYDAQAQEQIAIDASKRKLENSSSTLGSGSISPSQKLWSLQQCEPYCLPVYAPGFSTEGISASSRQNDDDILLHLSGDKDLYKFLEWTMEQLGSVNSYNASGSYYTGLNMWKKGRRELPLYVEEPKYIVVRREPDDFEQKLNFGDNEDDIPFIPPRGRKYFPHFSREDSFIPHRGKKDKLKDIFKYDELFFPHRGRKRTTSSVVESGGGNGGILHGPSGGYNNYQSSTAAASKNDGQTFGDCFTSSCDDITLAAASTAPSPHQQQMVTNQAENINAIVSSAAFHLPQPWQTVLADANNDAAISSADGHEDDCTAAECQKENDVKMNGFDQSAQQQKRQRQQHYSEGGAFTNRQRQRRRLLSSSSSSLASVEAGASTFLPLSYSDQLNRLHRYPIRKNQWRDYYIQQMAAQSRQFPPF